MMNDLSSWADRLTEKLDAHARRLTLRGKMDFESGTLRRIASLYYIQNDNDLLNWFVNHPSVIPILEQIRCDDAQMKDRGESA